MAIEIIHFKSYTNADLSFKEVSTFLQENAEDYFSKIEYGEDTHLIKCYSMTDEKEFCSLQLSIGDSNSKHMILHDVDGNEWASDKVWSGEDSNAFTNTIIYCRTAAVTSSGIMLWYNNGNTLVISKDNQENTVICFISREYGGKTNRGQLFVSRNSILSSGSPVGLIDSSSNYATLGTYSGVNYGLTSMISVCEYDLYTPNLFRVITTNISLPITNFSIFEFQGSQYVFNGIFALKE